ncbi:MAG: hypothetical protein J6Y82_04295 [Bacteroidales bacterium]|nr:hypothetical protein [Bacteroidales bacterium]
MKLIVKTLYGAEELLKKELETLGATQVETQRRAVSCQADKQTLYKINLWSRFALRVLMPVCEFAAKDDKELYSHIYEYQWEDMIEPKRSFMIDHISFSSLFPNSQFLAQRTKDAIVDKVRDVRGVRPSVDFDNPDILLNVHATDDCISVSLDASGVTLNHRGYRDVQLPTATNEVLAAVLVEMSGWQPSDTLIDPMCGSGSICIEAAMKARNIAPCLYRKDGFCFQNWKDYDEQMWNNMVDEAKQACNKQRLNIIGSDIDGEAIDIARLSALELSLTPDVRILRKSLREQSRTTESGIVITCPPTHQEETKRGLEDFYKEITYYLSHNYPDHDAWIYSTDLKALRAIEYRAEKKFQLYNGSQEGNFNLYPF